MWQNVAALTESRIFEYRHDACITIPVAHENFRIPQPCEEPGVNHEQHEDLDF